MDCAFCVRIDVRQHFAQNDHAVAFLDEFPITPGHSLIVPRRHEDDFLSLAPVEQAATAMRATFLTAATRALRLPSEARRAW